MLDQYQKEFIKLIEVSGHKHRKLDLFRDFCEMAAISLSNAVDLAQREVREARYLEIIKKYDRAEVERFPKMMAMIVESLETGFKDCLGELFMGLEFGNEARGQFFTPYEISKMMAMMVAGDVREHIEKKGFFTVNEPACGAGAMVIAVADTVMDQKINYQQHMHVVAQDIDATAVHMCYIQCSLLHIPAVVIQGNSLTMDEPISTWYTPAHVMGFWRGKLAMAAREESSEVHEISEVAEVQKPRHECVANVVPKKPDISIPQMSLF